MQMTSDTTVVGTLALATPTVEIVVNGSTVTGLTVSLAADITENHGISYLCSWSTGEAGATIDVSESGTYSVTVTASADGMEPAASTASVTLEFGEFGFTDSGITVYSWFGSYRPGINAVDGTTFTSSNESIVSVDAEGKLSYTGGELRRDATVTITATADINGRTITDTYRMTVLSEHHDMVTGESVENPVVSTPTSSEEREIWNECIAPAVRDERLPTTTRGDWNIVDIYIPDEEGHVSEGGVFTVPFDYFGVTAPDGYVFHIVHIVYGVTEILEEGVDFTVGDYGVTITVSNFSPFAFYAEPASTIPDDPDTPVGPSGPDQPSTPSQPSQPSQPGYDDDDEYIPPSGGTIIVVPGSTTTTVASSEDDEDMKVAIVACAAVGVLAALIAVFVWTDRRN